MNSDGHGFAGGDDGRLSLSDDEALWTGVELRRMYAKGWNDALVKMGLGGEKWGGLDDGELRRMVGERFATALEAIWVLSLGYLRSSVPDGNGGLRNGTGSGQKSRAASKLEGVTRKRGKRAGSDTRGVVQDEAAFRFKQLVDRRIRKLTREMEEWVVRRTSLREEKIPGKCQKCQRYAEDNWSYCPFDGQKIE